MKIATLIRWIFVGISIVACIVDIINAGIAFTNGQSWQQEGIIYAVRLVLAGLLGMASWAFPIASRKYWQDKKRGSSIVLGIFATLFTVINMLNAKAYTGDTWKPNKYVGGPATISTPWTGVFYQTDDWYLDILSYIAPLTLLSIVLVNLEEKEEESIEEMTRHTNYQIAKAKLDELRRKELAPLQAAAAADLGKGLAGNVGGFMKGMGINLPEKKKQEQPVEAQPVEQSDETPEEAAVPITATYEILPPEKVDTKTAAQIIGKDERTVRDWCLKNPELYGAEKATVGNNKQGKWLVSVAKLEEQFPAKVRAWKRSRQLAAARKIKRTRAREAGQAPDNISSLVG